MANTRLTLGGKLSRRLLYEQLAEQLKTTITRESLWGGHLPPEREIARTYGVSQDTVRRSLGVLVRDGLVVRRQGQGTRVLSRERREPAGTATRVAMVSDWGQLPPDYTGGILKGLGAGASEAGWEVSFKDLAAGEGEAALLAALSAEAPQGLILLLSVDPRPLVSEILQRQKLPVVVLDNHIDGLPVTNVRDDSFAGARLALEHLLGLGHTRIGLLDKSDPSLNPWRRKAYDDTLRAAGIQPQPELVAPCVQRIDAGFSAAEKLLELEAPPTAILAVEDFRARGAWDAADARGLEVGRDLAIVSLGGQGYVPGLPVELTSLDTDWEMIGRTATRELAEMMAGRAKPFRDVLLPGKLIVGRSSREARVGPAATKGKEKR